MSTARAVAKTVTLQLRAVRLLAVTIETDGVDVAKPTTALDERADRLTRLFLEQNWGTPKTTVRLRPLCYALMAPSEHEAFDLDVARLATRLERHLFGEQVQLGHAQVSVHTYVGVRHQLTAVEQPPAPSPPPHAAPPQAEDAVRTQSPPAPDQRSAGRARPIAHRIGFRSVVATGAEAALFNDVVFRHPVRPGESLHPGPVGRSLLVHEEIETVRFATSSARAESAPDAPAMVLCSVSFQTLRHRTERRLFIEALHELARTSANLLALRVMGAPPRVPRQDVVAALKGVRGLVRHIEWAVDPEGHEIVSFADVGLHALSLCLPESEPKRASALQRFLAERPIIQAQRMHAGVFGIRTQSEIERCAAAGVYYLTGPALGPLMDTPLSARTTQTP